MAIVLGKWRNAVEDAQIFHKTAKRIRSHPEVTQKSPRSHPKGE
ncbi:MAG: hypothetical protein ACPG5T_08800 [Endozoicomonas sp.]